MNQIQKEPSILSPANKSERARNIRLGGFLGALAVSAAMFASGAIPRAESPFKAQSVAAELANPYKADQTKVDDGKFPVGEVVAVNLPGGYASTEAGEIANGLDGQYEVEKDIEAEYGSVTAKGPLVLLPENYVANPTTVDPLSSKH